jgi:hypothetical protein
MPAKNLPAIYPLTLLFGLAMACVEVWHLSTIEGRTFSWFVRIGSLTALGLALLLLVQGLATWNAARSHLKRLARSPLEPRFREIAPNVPWDISLAPPRLTELMPVARMSDGVMYDFRALGFATSCALRARHGRRKLDDLSPFHADAERWIGVRDDDMVDLKPLFASPSHVENLSGEMRTRQHAALIQSQSWFELWRLSDAIVTLLERTCWRRAKADCESVEVEAAAEWFARCERLVALQIAFVLRDIVARTITCLFAAMLCLTFLTASHLLYSFNGRASMLTIDLLAVTGVALSAVWILVDMERDHVLSRLKTTTPGRVDINWDFIKRIAVYGVLPMLAVIASLFPEIGGTLFGWLEPIRKLSNF